LFNFLYLLTELMLIQVLNHFLKNSLYHLQV